MSEESQNEVHIWLDQINETAQEKANELSTVFGCVVEPAVFVVEPLKDAAIAYIKKPNATQTLKLLRSLGENIEQGLMLTAQAQLIRDADLIGKGLTGTASDPRFIDVNGKYDEMFSEINTGLLLRVQKAIGFATDSFKKK